MTIKEANIKIKQLENDINYWEKIKEIEFSKTQPQATKYDKLMVDGGIHNIDKNFNYVMKKEYIDKKINYYTALKLTLEDWVNNELKAIGEFEPLKAKIIELRLTYGLTWDNIAEATHFSARHCRRIYKEYSTKRLMEIKEASLENLDRL